MYSGNAFFHMERMPCNENRLEVKLCSQDGIGAHSLSIR